MVTFLAFVLLKSGKMAYKISIGKDRLGERNGEIGCRRYALLHLTCVYIYATGSVAPTEKVMLS